ncbi:nucleotidyltransferase domain-containing protein [Candidatus Uhrbacteria bacterium]|nr:nucleotidyltransferase domain-containing protein [Candidatus Uhrbacteria bacterium]
MTAEQSSSLQGLAQEFHLRLLYVFGSFARGDMHAQSDVDLAYVADPALSFEQQMVLQDRLRSILDLGDRPIDLVNRMSATPLLAALIHQEGRKLYGSPTDDERFYRQSVRQYLDAKPLQLATQQYVHERLAL